MPRKVKKEKKKKRHSHRHRTSHTEKAVARYDLKKSIKKDFTKVLARQSSDTFTFRCIDCCHNPEVCIKALVAPCILNGAIAEQIGAGKYDDNCLLCLLSPCFIGSYWSVGRNKVFYRKLHGINGLVSDDYLASCFCPWFIIMQLRNQINEEKYEQNQLIQLQKQLVEGNTIARN